MEPKTWTKPKSSELPNLDDTNISSSFVSASVLKALLIGGILFCLFYLYFWDSYKEQRAPSTAEDPLEARRKRLQKLEQASSQSQPQSNSVVGNKNKNKKKPSSLPATTKTKQPEATQRTSTDKESTTQPSPLEKQPLQNNKINSNQEEDDDMQILRLKRPAPEPDSSDSKSSAAAAAEARATKKRSPSPPVKSPPDSNAVSLIDVVKEQHKSTETPTLADPPTTSNKPTKRKTKTPRDTLLHALSSITEITIKTKSSPKTKTTTTSNARTLVLPDSLLPEVSTWKQIEATTRTNSLFQPLHKEITMTIHSNTAVSKRRLAKASNWYHNSKTWIRDHASLVDETAKEYLSNILTSFQQWIVESIVQQLRHDVATWKIDSNNNGTAMDIDDDDDDDLGLFADESYGGGVINPTPVVSTQKEDGNDKTLLGEVFLVLGDAAGPKILSKPFLSHLIQVYNQNNNKSDKPLATLLLEECLRQLPSPEQKAALEWGKTQQQINAITNLLTLSPDASRALASAALPKDPEDLPTEGKQWEEQSQLRSLLSLAAFTVPRFNLGSTGRYAYNDLLPQSYHASMVASIGPEYPVCLYSRQGYETALGQYYGTTKHCRTILKAARAAGALALKKMAATSTHPALRKGGVLFDWIANILETNEALVDMLQSDLLSPDTAQALCASRPFLLGIASSLLQMSSTNLSTRLTEEGFDAFDYRYFVKEGNTEKVTGITIPSQERCLIDLDKTASKNTDRPSRFNGATEFFFLTAGLLRVSLFPGFRVSEEFQSMLRNVFAAIQQLASRQPSVDELQRIRPDSLDQMQKCTSVAQGWNAFVDDPDVSPLITSFSLMQLQWVSQATKTEALASIPEWFVKLPAQWLAHVAVYTPHLLQPNQGEAAVQCATKILQAGTNKSALDVSKRTFSPPVLCQLIRIAGAFVREGVRRARIREKSKAHHRGRRGFKTQPKNQPKEEHDDFEMDIIDDRTLDIYHSFDARDLGVTVFTNDFVAKYLCPTLMRAYMAMDAVEGMDVEREYHFEKFEVKHEVADLLLRLWCHPNGQSRDALLNNLDEVAMNEFCSSIAGSLGFQLDQACQFILDIRDIKTTHEQSSMSRVAQSRGREIPPLSRQDAAAIDHHAKFLSFALYQCRRLLLILCYFSKEKSIAALLGGKESGSTKRMGKSAAPDLAAMFLNLMERITDEDGGIHSELEKQQLKEEERSAGILSRLGTIPDDQLQQHLHYLLHSRRFSLLEYGLDVSLLSHQFLALAARWHIAGASTNEHGKRTSKFMEAVVASDIFDPKRLRNVFNRLVGEPKEMSGTELENAAYILERDGHVDLTIWKDSYKIEGSGPDKGRGRKITAKQDRMSYAELESLVELKDIDAFLSDLEEAAANKKVAAVAAKWGSNEMKKLEEGFFTTGDLLKDEEYTESLKEWVVSSDSFLSKAGNGSFAHSYDSIVRGRGPGAMGSGKILAKEARKCVRLIPAPHPNTSCFVCFAEERTDLCKAIIIGAADTPFSMGIFEFDILFPTNYPQSPPLFNFKTTGDGRTRISSNLYNDGKVCISILGTYQAFDDSQRWNPSTSSLAQVLASLQTQLLGDQEPYFSDGFNHDSVRGTPAGERGSKRFNNKIRLHTLRYAMIAPLKHPPLGFEEVTKRHFTLCRKRVLAQARLWTAEAKGTPLYKSFVQSYEELLTLLSSNDLVRHKAPGQTGEKTWGSVPIPRPEFRALEEGDPEFVQLHQRVLTGLVMEETKSSTDHSTVHVEQVPTLQQSLSNETSYNSEAYNPWANGATGPFSATGENQQGSTGDGHEEDDDFEDMYT